MNLIHELNFKLFSWGGMESFVFFVIVGLAGFLFFHVIASMFNQKNKKAIFPWVLFWFGLIWVSFFWFWAGEKKEYFARIQVGIPNAQIYEQAVSTPSESFCYADSPSETLGECVKSKKAKFRTVEEARARYKADWLGQ